VVTIDGMAINNGSSGNGGGISNSGTSTVTNCTISGNYALNNGGGIDNSGTLRVANCTISGNSADGGGGCGIFNTGTVIVASSTFSGNTGGYGGGIANYGTATVTNSTFIGNSPGGAIYSDGTVTLVNSTLYGNTGGYGGGVMTDGGTLYLLNTIIAGNITTLYFSPDIFNNYGITISLGHNLIGNTEGCNGGSSSDLLNVDPLLGSPSYNGGPTQTMALAANSPAIDAGGDTVLGAPYNQTTDQRGFDRIVGTHVDIGAYEVGAETEHAGWISGRLFHDQNGNCMEDGGEPGLLGRIVEVMPGPRYATTDSLGNYSFFVAHGTYSVRSTPYPYQSVTCPGNVPISVTVSDSGEIDTGNDIALTLEADIHDLRVSLASDRIRAGRQVNYYLQYANVGTVATAGTLRLTYDSDALTTSTVDTFITHPSPNTLEWNFPTMQPGERGTIRVTMRADSSLPMGTWVCARADLELPGESVADQTPRDNHDSLCVPVTGSYDPNDKAVAPAGDNCGRLASEDTVLTYEVRFQNTGNDTAFTVVIRDTLDASLLDISTLMVDAASHPYTWKLEAANAFTADNVLVIRFDDILLPDSTTSEPNSHGIVKYSLHLRPDLAPGTSIPNRAAIYFDFNDPVVTNQVVSRTPDLIITGHPTDQDVVVGESASFSATASGATSVQWQQSEDGGATWSDIPDATSSDYSFTADLAQSGYQYRAVFDNGTCPRPTHPATLTVKANVYEFGPAVVFLGTSRNRDNGRSIDLKVELYRNSTLISSGELSSQIISGTSQNSARKYTIPLELTHGPASFSASDYLRVKVYARRNGGTGDFAAKAWYNDNPLPSINQGNKGWARVGFATNGGASTGYFYLLGQEVLSAVSGSSGESIERTLGTSWELFDTWSMAGSLLKPEESVATNTSSLAVRVAPNPFSRSTEIRFMLPSDGMVSVRIYDHLGHEVAVLLRDPLKAGAHTVTWEGSTSDGARASAGEYFYRIESAGTSETGRIVLVR
jgi:uncharacterized repeat protein (TIGR01451 family)